MFLKPTRRKTVGGGRKIDFIYGHPDFSWTLLLLLKAYFGVTWPFVQLPFGLIFSGPFVTWSVKDLVSHQFGTPSTLA